MGLREVTSLDRLYAQVSGLEKQAAMIRRELAAILVANAPRPKTQPTTNLIDPRTGRQFPVKNQPARNHRGKK